MDKTAIITCFSNNDPQFRGIRRVVNLLVKREPYTEIDIIDLHSAESKKLTYKNIIITGHGSPDTARISDNKNRHVEPKDLKIYRDAHLFLLCCYQGKDKILNTWAEQTALPRENIFGFPGETETALSTLFFLHLLEESTRKPFNKDGKCKQDIYFTIKKWFYRWEEANKWLSPYFREMRRLYIETNGSSRLVAEKLSSILFSEKVKIFTGIYLKHPGYLDNLHV